MKYSYYCAQCGYNAMTNDKQEARELGKNHRRQTGINSFRCRGLTQMPDNTWIRADLADWYRNELLENSV